MTIPYVTGTVSVTAGSAVVTGTGTAWATALIAGGLFGLDSSNGNPVPILSVDSNTQITLAKPWRGTTAAGQGYWIVRDTAYLQQQTVNAQALSTYIQRLDNAVLAALAGLTPAADKLAYFNGAATAVLADLRAKGRELMAAADLAAARTAIGLPLSAVVAADFDLITDNGWYRGGGTVPGNPSGQYGMLEHIQYDANHAVQVFYRGSTSEMWFRRKVAGVWQAWVKSNGEMVGNVSQSGGIPTGAIIERGSNSNGEYVRFADGSQICWGTSTISAASALSNHFGSTAGAAVTGNATITFPAAFANGNYSVSNQPTFRGFTVLGAYSKANSSCIVRMGVSGSAASEVPFEWAAIGRWF